MSKVVFIVFCSIIVGSATAQPVSEIIVKHFDWVVFNKDSTISSAFHIEDGAFNGYAIYFEKSANPKCIGKFHKGKPAGIWLKNNGGIIDYTSKQPVEMFPGCGTGVGQNIDRFRIIYEGLLQGRREPLHLPSITN